MKICFILTFVLFATGSNIQNCFKCFEDGKIYVRTLFSYSNFTSYCLNSTNELPFDSLPVWRACAWYECPCSNEPNMPLNRSNLCDENPYIHCSCSRFCSLIPSHSETSSGSKLVIPPLIIILVSVCCYHFS